MPIRRFSLSCHGTSTNVAISTNGKRPFRDGPLPGGFPPFTLDLNSGTWYMFCGERDCPRSGVLRSSSTKLFLDGIRVRCNGIYLTYTAEIDRVSGSMHYSYECEDQQDKAVWTSTGDDQCPKTQLVPPPSPRF
jgi:hypothetical protein